mmetsp:Transcript_46889/g.133760  ORF Transcript_46889/g.133760 Transcript_46889/m.133760 type:complete len:228 (-) Transcript_46889:329-1012(-)
MTAQPASGPPMTQGACTASVVSASWCVGRRSARMGSWWRLRLTTRLCDSGLRTAANMCARWLATLKMCFLYPSVLMERQCCPHPEMALPCSGLQRVGNACAPSEATTEGSCRRPSATMAARWPRPRARGASRCGPSSSEPASGRGPATGRRSAAWPSAPETPWPRPPATAPPRSGPGPRGPSSGPWRATAAGCGASPSGSTATAPSPRPTTAPRSSGAWRAASACGP